MTGLLKQESLHLMAGMSESHSLENLFAELDALSPSGCASSAVCVSGVDPEQAPEAERAIAKSWAAGRRREFAAGRLCARSALKELGIEAKNLIRDAEGLPMWPREVIGSISHCRDLCIAVVARGQSYALLGLDVERTDRLSDAAMARVLHETEIDWVNADQVRASLLFSLKEAFFKAQYPRWRTAGNFQDLALAPDLEAGTVTIQTMDARFAPELKQLEFGFRLVGAHVLSLCWLTNPPAARNAP